MILLSSVCSSFSQLNHATYKKSAFQILKFAPMSN
jgi:hypothetical protein